MQGSADNQQATKPSRIEKIFGAPFEKEKPDSYFSDSEQLDINGAINNAIPVKESATEEKREVFSTSKEPPINTNASNVRWLILPVIEKFRKCNAKTPPKVIANLLISLFDTNSQPGHWLWIAQHYYPLTIYRVLKLMRERQRQGWESIKSPSAYFTYKIKLRRKRRCFYK